MWKLPRQSWVIIFRYRIIYRKTNKAVCYLHSLGENLFCVFYDVVGISDYKAAKVWWLMKYILQNLEGSGHDLIEGGRLYLFRLEGLNKTRTTSVSRDSRYETRTPLLPMRIHANMPYWNTWIKIIINSTLLRTILYYTNTGWRKVLLKMSYY